MFKGVAAHRGNMSIFPENTMPAFASAVDLKCEYIELDIQFTKDAQIVVTHDASAKRVAGLDVVIANSTYKELCELDFGKVFRETQNKTIQEIPYQKLPLLSDVFELIKNTETSVSIQPKCDGIIKSVFKLAQQHAVVNQIAFNELNCEYLIEARRISNTVSLFWDRLPNTDFENDVYIGKEFNFTALMFVWQALNPEKIKKLQAHGIDVGAIVINDAAAMHEYLNLNIKRFYTDYPELLISILKNR
ncbi:MAG: hypothetical protein IPP32_15595 [Bacteroidetes bacterium]|nr:hypothetical protein [Bacteroidota bacterium]